MGLRDDEHLADRPVRIFEGNPHADERIDGDVLLVLVQRLTPAISRRNFPTI